MLDAGAVVSDRPDVDSDAFMDALLPVMPDAYRLACGMVRSRDEASDVVQEATLSAWRHRGTFRPRADVRPWFLTIVANQCRQAMRQRWWWVMRRSDMAVVEADREEARVDESERLKQGLRRLKHSDRLILVLRYYLDLSVSDVAAMLRVSPPAVKARTHRALARLRAVIGSAGDLSDE